MFAVNFILSFWAGVAFYLFASDEKFRGFLSLVGVFSLGWIMIAIITFYFGGGFINSFKKGGKK